MKHSFTKAWLIVIAGTLLTAAIPFAFYQSTTGDILPSILPQLETDTLYYLTQVKEIFDGHPTLGNPFIKEHADDVFPGLLLSMKLAAIPGIFGLGINMIFAVNLILYSLLTGVLLFVLCRHINSKYTVIAALMAVLGVGIMHIDLMRPIMQTIFPAFILFMMALLWVLNDIYDQKRLIALGAITTLTFYLYPYLWMTAFTAVGLLFLRTIAQKDWRALRMQVMMIIGITVLCIPQIQAVISLFYDESVRELNLRIGLTKTHYVLPITLWNMKYTIATTIGLLLLRTRRKLSTPEWMILLVGAALFIGSISNVVTGKQMDFDTHFFRLSLPWNIIALVVLAGSFKSNTQKIERLILCALCTVLFLTSINRALIRKNSFAYLHKKDAVTASYNHVRDYDALFAFLDNDINAEQVILIPDDIGMYLALYTTHYSLYEVKAFLHTIPDDELMTRFLTHHVDRVDDVFLRENALYAVGIAPMSEAKYRRAQGEDVTYLDFLGGDTFIQNTLDQHAEIRKNYTKYLKQFSVTYAIIDNRSDRNPHIPKNTTVLYDDERFTVYEVQQ
tara:strand:+ start:17747 stop:19429 length:1683 start_codon:yes stop_codon:yes gene_type:complete